MSRILFGNILGAEIFVVVSIPANMLWCLGNQSWGIHWTMVIVDVWIRQRIPRE